MLPNLRVLYFISTFAIQTFGLTSSKKKNVCLNDSSSEMTENDLTFWSCRENGLIRKMRLISKLMTSQTG